MRCYFYVLKSDRIGNRVFSLRDSGYLSLHRYLYKYICCSTRRSQMSWVIKLLLCRSVEEVEGFRRRSLVISPQEIDSKYLFNRVCILSAVMKQNWHGSSEHFNVLTGQTLTWPRPSSNRRLQPPPTFHRKIPRHRSHLMCLFTLAISYLKLNYYLKNTTASLYLDANASNSLGATRQRA